MTFTLPELPYAKDALAPHISAETLDFHYGKHHQAYVNNLNTFAKDDASLNGKSYEDLVRTTSGKVFNNAAQVWNHTFYWHSMRPAGGGGGGGGEPHGAIKAAIDKSFGGFSAFKEKFSAVATGHFGSGWAWLVKTDSGLEIVDSHDAGCPLTQNKKPVLTCDVWEHAYYIDYRNARAKYVEAWWNLVNWDHASKQIG